jgi:hypothetical protein
VASDLSRDDRILEDAAAEAEQQAEAGQQAQAERDYQLSALLSEQDSFRVHRSTTEESSQTFPRMVIL